MSSELAASLKKLDAELDLIAPNRDKPTYAYIKNKAGIACQLYISHTGLKTVTLAEHLRLRAQAGKETRLAYIWLNDKIASPKSLWNWREAPAMVDNLLLELRQASNAWRNVASWELPLDLKTQNMPEDIAENVEEDLAVAPAPVKKTTKKKVKK